MAVVKFYQKTLCMKRIITGRVGRIQPGWRVFGKSFRAQKVFGNWKICSSNVVQCQSWKVTNFLYNHNNNNNHNELLLLKSESIIFLHIPTKFKAVNAEAGVMRNPPTV